MNARLNNDFQFIDVGRKDPVKKAAASRKRQFVEIYQPFTEAAVRPRPIVAWIAAILTVSGNVRFITTFPTG